MDSIRNVAVVIAKMEYAKRDENKETEDDDVSNVSHFHRWWFFGVCESKNKFFDHHMTTISKKLAGNTYWKKRMDVSNTNHWII